MPIDRIEILIQRCVDNECSTDERRELIQLLDSQEDGWKNLACTYMEEQLFESACAARLSSPLPTSEKPVRVTQRPGHWFHHPAMSMLLSACVVCLLTVIGMEEYHQRHKPTSTSSGENNVASITKPSRQDPAASMAVSRQPQTAWLEADGMDPRQLPVYSDVSEFMPSLEAFRQQNYRSSQEPGLRSSGSSIRYIKLKVGDDYLLFPVEETAIERQFQ